MFAAALIRTGKQFEKHTWKCFAQGSRKKTRLRWAMQLPEASVQARLISGFNWTPESN